MIFLDKLLTWLLALLPTAVQLILGVALIRLVLRLVNSALERSRLEKAAYGLITSLIRVVLYVLLGLILASGLGIDVTGVVALASVLTLALSLSLQNMLTNVIGGFTLLYTHPFHSGDFVEIAGQSGTVQEITMTYIQLSTADNKQIFIPNSAVVAAQIVNYSAADTRRVEVVASASYEVPVQKVLDALVVAGTVEGVLEDPAPRAVVTGYGESAIGYSLRLWVKTENYWDVYYLVNQRVKEIFDQEGIAMTYPHLNVHLDK